MKITAAFAIAVIGASAFGARPEIPQDGHIEFVCAKTHKASNTCYYNFKVDGEKYKFVDLGCKYNGKKDEVIEKVNAGTLALSKDWKIACPEPKEKKEGL